MQYQPVSGLLGRVLGEGVLHGLVVVEHEPLGVVRDGSEVGAHVFVEAHFFHERLELLVQGLCMCLV